MEKNELMELIKLASRLSLVRRGMERVGIPNGTVRFEQALYQRTGLHLKELWPTEFAKSVTVQTMVAQVRRDFTFAPR